MTVRRWRGRSPKGSEGPGSGGEGNNWGYGQVPNEGKSDIDKWDTGSDNGPDNGRSDRLGDSVDEWMGGEPVHYLQSTTTQLVEVRVPHQTPGGKKRPKC